MPVRTSSETLKRIPEGTPEHISEGTTRKNSFGNSWGLSQNSVRT